MPVKGGTRTGHTGRAASWPAQATVPGCQDGRIRNVPGRSAAGRRLCVGSDGGNHVPLGGYAICLSRGHVLGRGLLVQVVPLDVLKDGARYVKGAFAVADLSAGLGGGDVVVERLDDIKVVLVLLERRNGLLNVALEGPLNDEGAIVA